MQWKVTTFELIHSEKLIFENNKTGGNRTKSVQRQSSHLPKPKQSKRNMKILLNAVVIFLTVYWSHGNIIGGTDIVNVSDSGKRLCSLN